MDRHLNPVPEDELPNPGRKIIMHPLYLSKMSSSLDLKVFYVRVSNCMVGESTPDHLTVNHIPLTPDAVLEVNGRRSSIYSECVSCLLRRDRVDKRSEVVTFVSTYSIKMTGRVRFEVYDRDELLLSGVLELCNGNAIIGEHKNIGKKWKMECQSVISGDCACFLNDKRYMSPEIASPTVEVYVAGCFSGTPIILSKTLKLAIRKKNQTKVVLDSSPEYETTTQKKHVLPKDALEFPDYEDIKPGHDVDIDYNSIPSKAEYTEWEDGELTWFNAGVRVGVGLGLGICLGIGIGVGLLTKTYQTTTRTFKRRFI